MPIITKNVKCMVTSQIGTDVYGQPKWAKPRELKCAVVKLKASRQHTTVRADSSGSRGHADEVVADALLLFDKAVKLTLGDKVEVAGLSLLVSSIQPRFNVMSRLDHYEVGCAIE